MVDQSIWNPVLFSQCTVRRIRDIQIAQNTKIRDETQRWNWLAGQAKIRVQSLQAVFLASELRLA